MAISGLPSIPQLSMEDITLDFIFRRETTSFLVKTLQWHLQGPLWSDIWLPLWPYFLPFPFLCVLYSRHTDLPVFTQTRQTCFHLRPQSLAFRPLEHSSPKCLHGFFFFPFSLDLYSLSQCRIKSIILHASTLYINATIFCFSSSFLKFILEIHPGCYIYLCIIHFIYCMYSIWQGQQH